MIRVFRPIPVLGVCLFPHGAVFQPNQCPAGQPGEGPVDAAHEQIQFRALDLEAARWLSFRRLLFGELSVSLDPGIELCQFVGRKLIQACGLELLRGHYLLNVIGDLFSRRAGGLHDSPN